MIAPVPLPAVEERFSWRALRPAGATALAAALILLAATATPRGDAQAVAAIFPPGTASQAIAAAIDAVDGRIVRLGAFANIVIVESGQPDLAAGLRAHGAWLVVDPIVVGACAPADRADPE
jgi:hypothetical protein